MIIARVYLLAAGLSLASAFASPAQRVSQSARPLAPSRREVRAELATTLLNASRSGEAAAEFRLLLADEPANHDYRLGLARALAWGDHPREAEHELLLARDRQNASVIEPLLRSVRSAFDPTAAQAAVWVRESPAYLPYRIAFAWRFPPFQTKSLDRAVRHVATRRARGQQACRRQPRSFANKPMAYLPLAHVRRR